MIDRLREKGGASGLEGLPDQVGSVLSTGEKHLPFVILFIYLFWSFHLIQINRGKG